MEYDTTEHCRICKRKNLEEVIDLGLIYPSNFVEETKGFEKVPLVLMRCEDCGLVQLKHTVCLDSMYRQYYYRSGLNPSMVKALNQIAKKALSWVDLKEHDTILDIGCNDGTLFKEYMKLLDYSKTGIYIGFDPALNLADEANENSDYFINDYFRAEYYPFNYRAKIITSIAMFYDLPDPVEFVEEIQGILSRDGIWILQFTDLVSMLKINAFDNICHEHLEYYSLRDITNLVDKFGMEVVDVSHNKVNGGSLQIVIAHQGMKKVRDSVQEYIRQEDVYLNPYRGLSSNIPFERFKKNVESIKSNVLSYLEHLEKQGKLAYGLGASTKGNTLLQYFGIENGKYIKKIADINKEKWGLKTIGTNIPIISQEEAIRDNPTTFLVLPWHFIERFTKEDETLIEYLNSGSFTVPMPNPALYFRENGHLYKMFLDTGLEDKASNRVNRRERAYA